jgi:hypothetical protein
MSPENLRKLIKEQLQNKLISGKLSECYLNGKEDKIKEHVEQELKIFTEKIKNLTNENKYPYVR